MAKWAFNYDSGNYEYIESDGFRIDHGDYAYNWDDSEYRREKDCRRDDSLWHEDDDQY